MKTVIILFQFVALLLLAGACKKNSHNTNTSLPQKDSIRIVSSGLNFPWEIVWGPDDHIWMTERGGRISRVDTGTGAVQPLLTISDVKSDGEGGLLGMVLHPDFSNQPYVFVVYNFDNGSGYKERVVRYTYENGQLGAPKTLIENIAAAGNHNGSRLVIDKNDPSKIWISTGDATHDSDAQLTDKPNGKILRLNTDGTIPADNPISGNPLWSLGHRNPQGLVQVKGLLYESEHGPDIEDEVNIIEKNKNYGWPVVKGPCDEPDEISFCNTHQTVAPIWSSGNSTVATSGLDYYNNDYISSWKNSLLLATLKGTTLYQLKLSDDGKKVVATNKFLVNRFGRLRDICIAPTGQVYVCTSNGNNQDQIIEINRP